MTQRATIHLFALAAAASFAATSAYAGAGCEHSARSMVKSIFQNADQDESGSLTRDEYDSAGLDVYGLTFEDTDLDGNGETSMGEYIELYLRHHPAGGQTEV